MAGEVEYKGIRYTPAMFRVWKNPLNMHGVISPGVLVYVYQERELDNGDRLYWLLSVETRVICRYLATAQNGGLSNKDVFEAVDTVHDMLLPFKCWWTNPAVKIPQLTSGDKPVGCYESKAYPKPPNHPYKPGDIVTVRVDDNKLGYVQCMHKFGESTALYYVYGFESSSGYPMYTLYVDDLNPPPIEILGINKWSSIGDMWWTRELRHIFDNQELRTKYLHFGPPRKGWEKDHFVSVPSMDGSTRVPAKIIRQFPAPNGPGPDGKLVQKRMYQVRPLHVSMFYPSSQSRRSCTPRPSLSRRRGPPPSRPCTSLARTSFGTTSSTSGPRCPCRSTPVR